MVKAWIITALVILDQTEIMNIILRKQRIHILNVLKQIVLRFSTIILTNSDIQIINASIVFAVI